MAIVYTKEYRHTHTERRRGREGGRETERGIKRISKLQKIKNNNKIILRTND